MKHQSPLCGTPNESETVYPSQSSLEFPAHPPCQEPLKGGPLIVDNPLQWFLQTSCRPVPGVRLEPLEVMHHGVSLEEEEEEEEPIGQVSGL